MKNKNLIVILFCFLISIGLVAQELPPIQNYSNKDYSAENQNWSISQSDKDYIYVANNSGLLEFNGAKWQLYPSPNNSVLRSVNVVGDRIYTGCFREFGYWIRNELGSLDYYSLSDKIGGVEIDDQHFWNIIDFEKWVLFQSLHNIYVYDTIKRTFNIINSETKLTKVFKVEDSIYFQRMDDGVYKIENGQPVLITSHSILQKNELVNMYSKDGQILFQTQEKGFFVLKNDKLLKWNISADDVISQVSVYSSIRLREGGFALGTISNGVYILDKSGNIINEINQKNGLNNNTVLSMFEDKEQNIWLGLDIGVSVINLKSPIKVFNDINGLLGSVYASAIFEGKLYLGTNQGLYVKTIKSNSNFKFVEGTEGQVWCLKVYDNTLFCGHNNGTYIINRNSIDLISDFKGTWDIQPFPNHNNLLLQGHYGGFTVLEKINKKWKYRNNISGFGYSCRYFGLNTDNEVFVNSEYKGVSKLILNDNLDKVLINTIVESAPVGLKSSLINYNNSLVYTSNKGVYKYDTQLEKFEIDSILSFNLFGGDNYISGKLVVDAKEKSIWGFTDRNVVYLTPGKLNNELRPLKISFPSATRNFVIGYENSTYLSKHKYLFGGSRGYLILDLDKLYEREYEIEINSIQKSILDHEKSRVSLKKKSAFDFDENNLLFQYNVPVYDKYNEVSYQYQLKGIYNDWSDWSTISEVSFKNLPFGDYTFNVKAKIGNQESINTESYSFSIDKPFYLSNQMLYVYGLIFIVFLIIIHRIYKYYYSKKQEKTLERSQRILKLENLESEKQLMKSRNDNLRLDIDNKNRELAISTMSLIKKNEFLHDIKKELKKVKGDSNLKTVLSVIDNNLNNSNDWDLFKMAFNNADSDFFKKTKELHPTLTPNDLKLCAFLRLNLSSKEIAPLLNISTRSVEIKRYRLRKKMELPHESNLIQYILEI